MPKITISIPASTGTIQCSPDGGHVRARQGADVEWDCKDDDFTLSFTLLDGRSAWPFADPPQPPVFQWTSRFRGKLAEVSTDPPPAYKYTIRTKVTGQVLDPIIIVDK